MKKDKSRKELLLMIISIVVIIILLVIIVSLKSDKPINENNIETKTLTVEGKEAKYIYLKDENDSVYGIKFENLDLMKKITIIAIDSEEEKEIKDLINDEGIYIFTEDNIYTMKIQTTNNRIITTDAFSVNI